MANTFLRKVSRNIGNTAVTVGSYTVGANIGAVVVGLSVSNTTGGQVQANVTINNGSDDYYLVKNAPILDSSTLVLVGNEQKVVLQTGDSIKVSSSDGPSLDVLMTVMETDGVGLTDDGGGGGGGTTYSGGVDYYDPPTVGSGSGLIFLDSGPRLLLQSFNWLNSNYTTLLAQGSGTVYTLTLSNGQTGTFTTTGAWSGNDVYGTTSLTGTASVTSITFTP